MKILIIKPSSFGDIVQANPTAVALKKAYPHSSLSWLVFDRWADIVSFFPDVNSVITWRRDGGVGEFLRVLREVRREKFDFIIDLQGLLRTALITVLSGAKRRVGVPGMKELSWLMVKEVYPESSGLNAVLRSLETVRYLTDSPCEEPRFNLSVLQPLYFKAKEMLGNLGIKQTDTLIGVVPSARGKAKEWPLEYYHELFNLILASSQTAKIVLLGDIRNVPMKGHRRIIDLSGKTSLNDLAGVLRHCHAVIGSDTGPVHLAAALGIPSIVIFGGSDVKETAPISNNSVVLHKEMECSPCRGRPSCKDYECLKSITPHEVFTALSKWL